MGAGRIAGVLCAALTVWVVLLFAEELVHAGWEKCWSRRESRPYYFNRFTNQSLFRT